MHSWAGEGDLELHLMVLVAPWQEKDLGLVLGELGEGAGRSAAGRSPARQKAATPARQGGEARSGVCAAVEGFTCLLLWGTGRMPSISITI